MQPVHYLWCDPVSALAAHDNAHFRNCMIQQSKAAPLASGMLATSSHPMLQQAVVAVALGASGNLVASGMP